MKTLYFLLIASAWAAWEATADAQQRQAPAGDKAGDLWSIHTFRVHPLSLRNVLPLAIGESIPPSAPGSKGPIRSDFPFSPYEFLALPSAGASEKEWAAHVQRTSTVLTAILETLGAPGLHDMAFLYDARSCTLAVRGTNDQLLHLQPVMPRLGSEIPHDLTFVVNVVQADSASIRSLVEETTGRLDHSAAWKRCSEWLAAGKAKTVGQYQWSGHSGQRAVLTSGQESIPVKTVQVDASGRVLAIRGEPHTAVYLEVDPEDPVDRFSEATLQIVDVPLIFQFDYAPLVERMEKVTGLLGNSTIDVPMLDYEGVKLATKISMYVGSQRLLAVWRPRGKPEFARGDLMQAAFLQIDTQPALPRENTHLAELLRKHAGPPPAVPQELPPMRVPDHGELIRCSFHVPERFAEALKLPEGQSNVQPEFEQAGISFPPGSDATYISAIKSLNVRNTPSSIERIKTYVKEVSGPIRQFASNTAYVIEGESSVVRELTAQARDLPEHSRVWERVQKLIQTNTLRIVEVARSEARFDERASFEFGTTRHNTGEILLNDAAGSEANPNSKDKDEGKNKDTPAEQPPTQVRPKAREDSPATLQIETSFEGTRMEWEAFQDSEDKKTVTLHLVFYHDTAPTTELQVSPSPGSILPAGLPKTRFHYTKVSTASRFHSGTIRLMSTWEKEGSSAQEGRDLSQALFLRVDVIPMDRPE